MKNCCNRHAKTIKSSIQVKRRRQEAMIMLDLPAGQAQELLAAIESAGGQAEIVEEKRFFGDAGTMSLVFEGTKSVVELVSLSLSVWCSYQQIKGSKNGVPILLDKDQPAEVAEKLN
jgi:hypothetical protein